MRLKGTVNRPATKAEKEDDWSELLKSKDLNAWTRVKIQECYCEVRQEENKRKSIV